MINFSKIRYKNLLSSGNTFTSFDLDRSQTTLIVGDNGAGKSTLLDALCFVLYGKGFRNLKKDLLVNSINQKDLVVEIEFTVGRKSYKVIRGAKPNKFELYVNGTMLNQDATVRDYQEHLEKNILKMSFRSFTQVAVLGSANFTPFMQLKSVERRRLVEDLLDISIFSTMQDILKKRVTQHNIDVRETKHNIELLEERISGLNEQVNLLSKSRDKKVEKYENTIRETQSNIDSVMGVIKLNTEVVKEKRHSISDRDPQGDRLKRALDLESKLEESQRKALKEIEFYKNNDDCPTCKQGLDEQHKKKHIKDKSDKVSELKAAVLSINETIDASRNRMAEINDVLGDIEEVQRQIGLHQTEILSNQKYIEKLNQEISDLKSEVNSETGVNDKLSNAEDDLDKLHSKKESLTDRQHYFDLATTLLRDQGVRQRIIKQYVPVMNKMINKYLANLEFYVGFELNESFEETIKSRFRDVFKYDNFSQGEKMRIDLALLFTWRAVARIKNSVNTNILILDEVFDSSLDSQGTDDFLKLLNSLNEKTNAFIISHKGDQLYDKFEEVVRFEKHKNFSRIAIS
jgi:DNA repair exonuclease SbcCD ATPase subunit